MDEKVLEEQVYFSFRLGNGEFAVPVRNVREVLKMDSITQVPKALPYLKGVMNIRGSVITVVDFRTLFGFKSDKQLENCSIIVLEIPDKDGVMNVLGMIADSVDVVTKLNLVVSENFDYGIMPGRKDFIRGVAKKGDGFTLILDLEKIMFSIEKELEVS